MIILVAQLYFLWYIFKYYSSTKFYKALKSAKLAVVVLILGFVGSFLLGMGVVGKWSRWYMLAVGIVAISNLWVIVLERIKALYKIFIIGELNERKRIVVKNICFVLNHLGLMLFVVGGIYGVWGTKNFKVALPASNLEWRGETFGKNMVENRVVGTAPVGKVNFVQVGKDTIGLKSFVVESRGGGIGSYNAVVMVNNKACAVEVNSPINLRFGEKLYLSGYNLKKEMGEVDNVVVMFVREKWGIVIKIGVIMLLVGALGMLFIKD